MSQSKEAIAGGSFNENRIGLDHLSLSVASIADLEAAVGLLDAKGVSHGEIKPLEPFGITAEQGELAFRNPDNRPGGADCTLQGRLMAPRLSGRSSIRSVLSRATGSMRESLK